MALTHLPKLRGVILQSVSVVEIQIESANFLHCRQEVLKKKISKFSCIFPRHPGEDPFWTLDHYFKFKLG